ncbi:hypothetical protein [Streptomyces sp. NPDC093589]|uniref:hypothetical protein n=1 Tax=Streptomyces sp. NPDC093589 TaxID=3366043 RepID=UPI003811D2D4
MRHHRLHAAATAVVMRPLELLVTLIDRAVYARRRRRDRARRQEMARRTAREIAADQNRADLTEQILAGAYRAFYESTPHPTA